MGEIPAWLKLIEAVIAVLWIVSILFVVWVIMISEQTRMRVQYWLVRIHFFKGFVRKDVRQPFGGADRFQQMSIIRTLRLIVSAIAFINFITALVLMLTGLWLSTLSIEIDTLIQVLVLAVAPLLLLLALHSMTLFFLLNSTYKYLLEKQAAADG